MASLKTNLSAQAVERAFSQSTGDHIGNGLLDSAAAANDEDGGSGWSESEDSSELSRLAARLDELNEKVTELVCMAWTGWDLWLTDS